LERASEIPNIRVKVAVYTTLGQVFDRIGPEELAVRMLNLAVSEAEESGDLISLATAYHEIGAYMHYRGESAAASGLFEKAVAYLEKRGDIAQLARAIVYLGMAYSDCGELDKSLASLRRALALNRKMGHGLSTASILGNIGYTLAMMGRHEESLSHQEESLQIRMKQNSPDGMGWSYYDMSLVHGQMGELGRAVECLDKASECFVSTGNDIGLTYAKAAKADLLAEMGDGSTAESLYREVLDVAERKSMGTEQFQALTALADLGALVPDKAVPRLREIAKRMARLSTAMALEDFLGRLSAAAGERDAAEGHFAAGLDMANGKTGMEADIGSAGILLSRAGARLSHGKNNLAAADAAEAARLFRKWGRFREARKAEALRDAAPPKI
jgi:tetratricopeptide (TPR) repeat protein